MIDGSSKTGGGGLVHLDTDNFNGFYLTNNWIVNGATGTGFFVDGNHNVGPYASRTPLISDNLVDGNDTGMNLGSRAFGSLAAPIPGPYAGTIINNTFSNNNFDGLQGGFQHILVSQNSFIDNGRSGLALTSFGNTVPLIARRTRSSPRTSSAETVRRTCFSAGQGGADFDECGFQK